MTLPVKTPVEIVQELIAIHTTRKEAGERLLSRQPAAADAAKLVAACRQSEKFIIKLMDELSTFGDAVQSEVNRENDYQALWVKALPQIDTMDSQQAAQTFQQMENKLADIYQKYLDTTIELPESLQTIINGQEKEI